jgi:hypothetical protein
MGYGYDDYALRAMWELRAVGHFKAPSRHMTQKNEKNHDKINRFSVCRLLSISKIRYRGAQNTQNVPLGETNPRELLIFLFRILRTGL